MVCALGFRAHMGWANAVVLTGVPDEPVVVDRRDVQLRPRDGGIGFPYHAAADVPPDEREAVLAKGMRDTELRATDVLMELAADVEADAIGVVIGRGVRRIPLDRILASSQLFHTAEGEVYQLALRGAATNLGLPLSTVTFDGAQEHEAWDIVGGLRKQVGAPWQKDHKFAAVAAWVAALSAPPSPFSRE